MNSIIGTWYVIGGQIYDGESDTRFTLREGSLCYERDGTFAASCKLVAATAVGESDGEAGTQCYPYDYAGRYKADAALGVIEHHILSSSSPDDIGTTVLRRYQLIKEFLSVTFPVDGSPSGNDHAGSSGYISLKRGTP